MLTRLVTDYGSTAGNLLITLLTVLISNSLICTWLVSNMQQMATHTWQQFLLCQDTRLDFMPWSNMTTRRFDVKHVLPCALYTASTE